jgi:hypothetical protein
MQKPLIKAVAGTKHHTMLAKTNGAPVPIFSLLSNHQTSHANLPEAPEGTLTVKARTLTVVAWPGKTPGRGC